MRWLFLLAYTASGFAGLVYEVVWTRLLTLYIGHTTAAASAVVAAFLGGLAVGASVGGRLVARLSRRQCLQAYIALEVVVAAVAVLLPSGLTAVTPLLRWAYDNGDSGLWFSLVRLTVCLLLIFIPAAALGATFPLAIRWFATRPDAAAHDSGTLYATNTAGAAVGALLAGFVLVPAIGVSGATWVGVAASATAALSVFAVLRRHGADADEASPALPSATPAFAQPPRPGRANAPRPASHPPSASAPATRSATPGPWLAMAILGVTGFASLMHEIVWTRILALLLGPTIYAFAATLAAVIGGVALGSAAGTWLVGRTRQPATWLALALAAASITTSYTYSLAGHELPSLVARQMAESNTLFDQLLQHGVLMTLALVLPTAFCLGAAFPLTLAIVRTGNQAAERRFGLVYAINTVGAVVGSLAAGFVFIPWFGLQATLQVVSACLIAAALVVVALSTRSGTGRALGVAITAVAGLMLVLTPSWDRELLASGGYLYARYVPKDLDLETLLKAGTLLYYREGAGATVSVKKLTGTTTLAVDGKTDASNRGDMLTQKLIAHLPLLLHDRPQEVGIIGFGSGMTVGAALRHPVSRVDVVEISPEVVEASRFFAAENNGALEDPRTNLIVGDGRSHLLLSQRRYDVIVSEPSNPWIAGVAALFTHEFFVAARARLAPGGIICQWANGYNISDRDLRSIVATFRSVFPDGTVWLVGSDDVLLVGSLGPTTAAGSAMPAGAAEPASLNTRLANIARHWNRPGVAEDLASMSATEPFALLSLFAGGPDELARYAGTAPILTDDRMTLEFSGPRELHGRIAGQNSAALSSLLGADGGPEAVKQARSSATASQWRSRGAMMARADMHATAYDDYVRALTLDPSETRALDGLVRTAILLRRGADALAWVKGLSAGRAPSAAVLIATSKLLAAVDARADALDTARQASRLDPLHPAALEQIASLQADAGDTVPLDATVAALRVLAPDAAATHYYAAVAALLHGDAAQAVVRAQQAIASDPTFAPVYDLIGAAYTRLEQPAAARQAFQTSLTFDAHDSAAYTNLGLLDLAAGNRDAAARYFAEALWLEPDSATARAGLARSR